MRTRRERQAALAAQRARIDRDERKLRHWYLALVLGTLVGALLAVGAALLWAAPPMSEPMPKLPSCQNEQCYCNAIKFSDEHCYGAPAFCEDRDHDGECDDCVCVL